jgi:hypothetical protein
VASTNPQRLGPTDRGYVAVTTDANGLSTVKVSVSPGASPFAVHFRCTVQDNGIMLRDNGTERRSDFPVDVFRTPNGGPVHLVPVDSRRNLNRNRTPIE